MGVELRQYFLLRGGTNCEGVGGPFCFQSVSEGTNCEGLGGGGPFWWVTDFSGGTKCEGVKIYH